MIKEIKLTKTYCDCCETEHDAPVSIAGYASQVGWTNIREIDLCGICANKLNTKAVHKLDKEDFDKIVDELKKEADKSGIRTKIFVSSIS